MKLSVVIPIYNEVRWVNTVLERVRAVPMEKEIIVVDDRSTDGTREVLERLEHEDVKVIYHEENQGKGAGLVSAQKHVTGDVVIIQDADLEYFPEDYPALIQPIQEGKARVVFGSRFLGKAENMHFLNWVANKFLTWLTNLLFGSHITDACTCYKVFAADIYRGLRLDSRRFDVCQEIAARVLRDGESIYDVPIRYRARRAKEGKKVGWRQLFISTKALFHYARTLERKPRRALVSPAPAAAKALPQDAECSVRTAGRS